MWLKIILGLLIIFNFDMSVAKSSTYAQARASIEAVEFLPGLISTKEFFEINTVFNRAGNHLLFARCTDDFKICRMMEAYFTDGQWGTPKELPFVGDYLEADPYFSPDEKFVYFVSNRPTNSKEKLASSINLWRVRHTNRQWGEPEFLASLSSNSADLYPSLTQNGDLYFPSFRNNSRALYFAKATDDGFERPVPMPSHIYGEGAQIGDSVVLSDGRTIILSMRREDSLGAGDLYISFKRPDGWTVAKSLGDKVNTPNHEFTPIVSPDGKYLFFTRIENGRGNLYQIALSPLLENL